MPRSAIFKASIITLSFIVFCALFAGVLVLDHSPNANKMDLEHTLLEPGSKTAQGTHYFGTDKYGRDHFSRVLLGSRISLGVGLVSVLVSIIIGIPVGACAGYFGGRTDSPKNPVTNIIVENPINFHICDLVAPATLSIK